MSGQWQPRPDPALDDPMPEGLRVHQHPRNRLHAWVFLQHMVWVDYWGNEHEIQSMRIEYVENVIGFCWRRAAAIRVLVALSAAAEALALCRVGRAQEARRLFNLSLSAGGDPIEWLESTPLLRALRRRLPTESRRSAAPPGTDAQDVPEA